MTTEPTADRDTLRQRIAEVLWPLNAERAADAVLAVLPAPADRAAVYAEVAELVRSMAPEHSRNAAWVQDCHHIADRIDEASPGFRRLADEAQQPEPEAEPTAEDIARANVLALHQIGEQLAGIESWMWEHLANVRDAAKVRPERPRCPHCGLPHDLSPSMELACASIRASIADHHPAVSGPVAGEQPNETPETEAGCAHCGKTIRRITGTLAEWWVHDPGGNTVCFPEQAASSPRATPKPAGVPTTTKPLLRPTLAARSNDATVDPAMCPRCKGDNREAFELCAKCAAGVRQDGAQP